MSPHTEPFLAFVTALYEGAAWEALRDLGCVQEDERFAEGRCLAAEDLQANFSSLSGAFFLARKRMDAKPPFPCPLLEG